MERAEVLEGVDLGSLDEGSVIDIETKNRHYRLEYLGRSEGLISGHPRYCPSPVLVKLEGSTNHDTVKSGFIGRGMHLWFRRIDDQMPVTTSEVTDIRLVAHV
jgi:hypothetical protein